MTDDSGAREAGDSGADRPDEDDDEPIYMLPFGAEEVPGFCDRLVAHLLEQPEQGEFMFEGVDCDETQGVWLVPMGGYDDEAAATFDADAPDAIAVPEGGFAHAAISWTESVRHVLHETWGAPLVRTPRLVGESQDPEGILDYLMVDVGVPEAEMWDRGELCCVLMTWWTGEPRESTLAQMLVVLPRRLAFGSLSELADPEVTVQDLLMRAEHPLELRRRAWLMSGMFGAGEVRVRDTAVGATRCSLQARDGTTTVWTFADDGRILVLLLDPDSRFARDAPRRLILDQAPQAPATASHDAQADAGSEPDESALQEAWTILAMRMLDDVPDDLVELIAAPAIDVRGKPAVHDLEFRTVGDRAVPVITGVAWYDGEHWRVPVGALEIGVRSDLDLEAFGFADAVMQPYRLGGTFSVEDFADPRSEERWAWTSQWFDACPYPEQPRPEGDVRLGYGLPTRVDLPDIVTEIERASEAWWDESPDAVGSSDSPFRVGGRSLRATDDWMLTATLAVAERWTIDVLEEWSGRLVDAMTARWGRALAVRVRDEHGVERDSPITRLMRSSGFATAPLWWVNGHAVLLLAGFHDTDRGEEALAELVISRADLVLDMLWGTDPWALRMRARTIGELASIAADAESPRAATESISWDGPALEGSTIVPDAVRGAFHVDDRHWVWCFTHVTTGGRALLMSWSDAEADGAEPPSFEQQVARFAGVPERLLSLVVDRDPGGLYPVVTRDGEPGAHAAGRLARARSLPAVDAVFWLDGVDWLASDGMLRAAHDEGMAGAAGTGVSTQPPMDVIDSQDLGVPQLRWAVEAGRRLSVTTLAAPSYAQHVLDRPVELDEAELAFARLGTVHEHALTGSLNDMLDVLDTLGGFAGVRSVLDAALSNPEPQHRREIALWLLERPVDASVPLSFLTPINVLFENPTLDAGDEPVLRRLLERGATPGSGLVATTLGGHPLVQLASRDLDESELEPLVDALLERAEVDDAVLTLPDGTSALEHLERAELPHNRSRAALLERLRQRTAAQQP